MRSPASNALCRATNSKAARLHWRAGINSIQRLSIRRLIQDGAILQPERFGLELVLDAEADNPNARAINYMDLVGGSGNTLLLRDELTDTVYEVNLIW